MSQEHSLDLDEYSEASEYVRDATEQLLEEGQVLLEGEGDLEPYAEKVWNRATLKLEIERSGETVTFSELEDEYYIWLDYSVEEPSPVSWLASKVF